MLGRTYSASADIAVWVVYRNISIPRAVPRGAAPHLRNIDCAAAICVVGSKGHMVRAPPTDIGNIRLGCSATLPLCEVIKNLVPPFRSIASEWYAATAAVLVVNPPGAVAVGTARKWIPHTGIDTTGVHHRDIVVVRPRFWWMLAGITCSFHDCIW